MLKSIFIIIFFQIVVVLVGLDLSSIPSENGGCFGAVAVMTPGIQNGPNDGFALVFGIGTAEETLLEFLSSEGGTSCPNPEPAEVEMLSLNNVPPTSLHPASRSSCANLGPSLTHEHWILDM